MSPVCLGNISTVSGVKPTLGLETARSGEQFSSSITILEFAETQFLNKFHACLCPVSGSNRALIVSG